MERDERQHRSHLTFRLKGVPFSYDKADVRERLCQLLDLDPSTIRVCSLARDPFAKNEKIATLTLPHVSDMLRAPNTSDVWILRDFGVGGQDANPSVSHFATLDTNFYGLTPLHSAQDADCDTDCIAISGLNGHAFGSFKARGGDFMWLRDALPRDLQNARIYIYGYDTTMIGSASAQTILDLGQKFIQTLKCMEDASRQKIMILGHSLGGLVVEAAITNLVDASVSGKDRLSHQLIKSIRGLLFFAVPQQGLSSIHALRAMVRGQPNEDLVSSLSFDSEFLQLHRTRFHSARQTMNGPGIVCFYETQETNTPENVQGCWKMSGPPIRVVSRPSATYESDICVPIDRNHSDIVKFPPGDSDYQIVLKNILQLMNSTLPQKEMTSKEREALQSLAFLDQDSRESDIAWEMDTCHWLIEHEIFRTWLTNPTTAAEQLLWVRGNPGSGKSTVMKYALSYLQDEASHMIIASFFFHARGEELQKTRLGFARSILNQLLAQLPRALAKFTALYEKKSSRVGRDKLRWAEAELIQLIEEHIREASKSRQVILVVDALDEGGEETAAGLVRFFQDLVRSQAATISAPRILFSCRHYPILPSKDRLIISMELENESDINKLVRRYLQESVENDEFAKVLEQEISSKANGMFQWAVIVTKLAISRHNSGASRQMIVRKIRELPDTLNHLYQSLLAEPSPGTRKLFQWILFSIRPLTLEELQHALAADQHMAHKKISDLKNDDFFLANVENGIKDLSKGLVEVRKHSRRLIVQFIHQSVPDYLLLGGGFLKLCDNIPSAEVVGRAHIQLSRSCIRYLLLDDMQNIPLSFYDWLRAKYGGNPPESISEAYLRGLSEYETIHGSEDDIDDREAQFEMDFPLVEYARRYWILHVMHVESESLEQQDLLDLLPWHKKESRLPPSLVSPFTYSEYWDSSIFESLEEDSERFKDLKLFGDHQKIYFLELAKPWSLADVPNRILRDNLYSTTKDQWESGEIWLNLVNLLALSGIWSALKEMEQREPGTLARKTVHGESTLFLAMMGNPKMTLEPLWQTLEPEMVNVGPTASYSPLALAVAFGREDLVRAFLNANVGLDRLNGRGELFNFSALSMSAMCGNETIARLLIDAGADIHPRVFRRMTALHLACENGCNGTVNLLMKTAARLYELDDFIDAQDIFGNTALFFAIRRGNPEIVRTLLSHGANPNHRNKYETSLSIVMRQQDINIAQAMLEHPRTDLDLAEDAGITLLMEFSRGDHWKFERCIDFCLSAGRFKVDLQDKTGESALFKAVTKNHTAIVDKLLAIGRANPNTQDIRDRTPLIVAAYSGFHTVARLLLAHPDIDVSLRDISGRTACTHAADWGHSSIAKSIMDAGGSDASVLDAA